MHLLKRMIRVGGAAVLGMVSLFWAHSLFAQGRPGDVDGLRRQVEELVVTSQRNFQELAKAMNMFTELKNDLQGVKGQLDSAKYLTKESEKVYQDLDLRVASLEDKIGQIHTMIKEMRIAGGDPTSAKTAMQQSKEYEEFQGLLNVVNAQDWRGGASGMMGFLKKYPQSPLAGSAQYWVAESFYSMGDYVKAISEFQALSEKYPASPRVKEAIFKQGMAFQRLKKYPEAKLFYQKVMANYPNSAEALKAQTSLGRLENLESSQVALEMGPAPKTPAPTPTPKPSGEPVYNRPIMKPVPYPGSQPTEPKAPEPKAPEKSEAPLF